MWFESLPDHLPFQYTTLKSYIDSLGSRILWWQNKYHGEIWSVLKGIDDFLPGKKSNIDEDGCKNSEARPAAQVEFLSGLAESFCSGNMANQLESLHHREK